MATSKRSRKRKRSTSSGGHSRGDLEEEPVKITCSDLMCPICFDLYNEVYMASCGHNFCYACIQAVLRQSQQCPVCKTPLPGQSSVFPNSGLNDVVVKFRMQSAANREVTKDSRQVEEIRRLCLDLTREQLEDVQRIVGQHSQSSEEKEEAEKKALVQRFLDKGVQKKEKERERLDTELAVMYEDRHRLLDDSAQPGQSQRDTVGEKIAQKSLRIDANFEEILEDYLIKKLPPAGEVPSGEDSLSEFTETLHKFTRYQSFRELSTLAYGDQTSGCCIVSSLEFDKDGEFFAVAGVTRKIKVFEYHSVVNSVGFTNHFPVHEMSCGAKLSCVAYNPYHKHRLVSSDYEGCVCIWDTNVGRRVSMHQEHGRRVWSVAFNPLEPNLFASGSDDCTVKLWNANQLNSIFSLSAKANICSVKFNPHSRYLLAYGSADHEVRYLDLRKPSHPLLELRGHKKAVSYVHFMGPQELVSASTDSELKLWDTETGVCRRTYRGHANDKNFVGLTVTPDFIACGSENNAVYCYSKQVSTPMLTYQYNTARGVLPTSGSEESQPEPNEFVSAVCWRNASNVLLAANSQGHIKVLEMC